jgi:metal-dependent hydrolase (beta-lactamase superfamily II)
MQGRREGLNTTPVSTRTGREHDLMINVAIDKFGITLLTGCIHHRISRVVEYFEADGPPTVIQA